MAVRKIGKIRCRHCSFNAQKIYIHPSMQEFLLCQYHFDVLALHTLATCCLVTAVIGSSLTTILNQLSRKQWMDIAQLENIVYLFVFPLFVS